MRWWRTLGGLLVLAGAVSVQAAGLQNLHTRATLLLSAETARPGETITAAIRLQMDQGWHTYWRNPGESGMATSATWELPAGVTAGDLLWPPPEAYTVADMTTYVYHREVLLLVPLTLGPNLKPGPLELKGRVDWLECEVACVPGSAEVAAALRIGSDSQPSPHVPLIERWRQRIPKPDLSFQVHHRWEAGSDGKANLVIEGSVQTEFRPDDFFPYPDEQIEVSPAVTTLPAETSRFAFSKAVRRLGEHFPTQLKGILVQPAEGERQTKAIEVAFTGPDPAAAGAKSGSAVPASPTPGNLGQATRSLWAMLGLAFLGGLILNIMPCVLPVLALKILGFVQQSKEAPDRVKRLGLMYGAGVLASFLVMAAVVVSVQQAGGGASWGMQMQNPYFRLGLLVVVLLVALNLFGVFEVTLGGSALGAASRLASQGGYTGAFFNGILATALGTSCTAPILAIAVGFAFTQPAWVVVIMFLTIGLGLAFPYVLLSWNPSWLRLLPKPGPWMQQFKVAMGFPMLGTAVWMFEFTAPSYGPGGILWLGMFLAVIAMAAWVWGEFAQRSSARRGWAVAGCLALLSTAYVVILEGQLHWRNPVGAAGPGGYVKDSPDGLEWWPWSPEAVRDARQKRGVILVDFTAKWCPNCRSNKKFAIDIPSVRARLKELDGLAFRADYTDRDPRITEELKRHQRAGVPLVLVYPRDPDLAPLVLPELLTPSVVLEALNQAAGLGSVAAAAGGALRP